MTINHRINIANGNQYISPNLNNNLKIDRNIDHNSELLKLNFAEKKIVELIAQHKTSRQIAELLFISEKTVEGHRTNIIQKLGLPKEKNTLLVWASWYFKVFQNGGTTKSVKKKLIF